jgi:hypothetical protein
MWRLLAPGGVALLDGVTRRRTADGDCISLTRIIQALSFSTPAKLCPLFAKDLRAYNGATEKYIALMVK